MRHALTVLALAVAIPMPGLAAAPDPESSVRESPSYSVHPVGWIRKSSGKTYIEIEQRYQPALMGVEELRSIWVLYWFDRNDTPEKRSVLQVHPRGYFNFAAEIIRSIEEQAGVTLGGIEAP